MFKEVMYAIALIFYFGLEYFFDLGVIISVLFSVITIFRCNLTGMGFSAIFLSLHLGSINYLDADMLKFLNAVTFIPLVIIPLFYDKFTLATQKLPPTELGADYLSQINEKESAQKLDSSLENIFADNDASIHSAIKEDTYNTPSERFFDNQHRTSNFKTSYESDDDQDDTLSRLSSTGDLFQTPIQKWYNAKNNTSGGISKTSQETNAASTRTPENKVKYSSIKKAVKFSTVSHDDDDGETTDSDTSPIKVVKKNQRNIYHTPIQENKIITDAKNSASERREERKRQRIQQLLSPIPILK